MSSHYQIPLTSDQLNNIIKLVDIEIIKADVSLNVEMEDYWRKLRQALHESYYWDSVAENDE